VQQTDGRQQISTIQDITTQDTTGESRRGEKRREENAQETKKQCAMALLFQCFYLTQFPVYAVCCPLRLSGNQFGSTPAVALLAFRKSNTGCLGFTDLINAGLVIGIAKLALLRTLITSFAGGHSHCQAQQAKCKHKYYQQNNSKGRTDINE